MDHEHAENRIAAQRIDERVFLQGSRNAFHRSWVARRIQFKSYYSNAARGKARHDLPELSEISYTRP